MDSIITHTILLRGLPTKGVWVYGVYKLKI